MEFKRLIISRLTLFITGFFLIPAFLMADITLSTLCLKLKIGAKYNITYGFVDLNRPDRSVRIYLTIPYIVTGGNIYYMNNVPVINPEGEIELTRDFEEKITELFAESNTGSVNISGSSNSSSISMMLTNGKSDLGHKTNYNVYGRESGFIPIDMVIIDPGHGGKDPGGISPEGIKEKEVVLSVADMAGQILKSDCNIPVVFTRKGDYYVPLKERIDTASILLKKGKNPIFVSIHGNISFNRNVKGLEVYTLSDRATDNEALAVETMENAGYSSNDIDKTANLDFILSDLLKDAIRKQSEELSKEIGLFINRSGLTEFRGNKKANFFVLKFSYMPSVLIEIGYLSNPGEARNLINRDYQRKIASEIARGINSYIVRYNKTRGL